MSGKQLERTDDNVTKLQTAGTCSFIGQGIMARVVIKASFHYLKRNSRFILDAEMQRKN